jgi:hypothetical protein
MHLIKSNPEKINWFYFSSNPSIFNWTLFYFYR